MYTFYAFPYITFYYQKSYSKNFPILEVFFLFDQVAIPKYQTLPVQRALVDQAWRESFGWANVHIIDN